ncbi:integrase arm-type DNA-binding domain-containing protein [Novosphingobium sp. SG707]|uniref:tyrosine-type recombinase/integrase n=1 Tax=Novosphingobium sp. SG707 TaxID=2586996 RepID=UPI0014456281|nr:integrase arm-type DNA-binding domain-containing protein [Novosphingobium sp. SG707]NKJ00337.1 integrase [Novosphingobium sp. SG707]
MALSDLAIRNAKAREKSYKIADSLGLFLQVQPTGSKLWRFKYRFDGREKKLGLGIYPSVGLAEARKRRDQARELIAAGSDPSRERRREKLRRQELAGNSFALLATEYCKKRKGDGHKPWAPSTAERCEHLLGLVSVSIGRMAIADIEPADVLAAVRKIERKGKLESARRALQLAGSVFRFAVATARLRSDPTRDLRGALASPKVTHYGAITEAHKVGQLLRDIDSYQGIGIARLALKVAPHVFVRPGELRQALWNEIDLEGALWVIPAERMKVRKAHYVPLSRQVIDLFKDVRRLSGPKGYVFPSVRSRARPMSENTINGALRRLGYTTDEMTGHGFRAMASTLLNESGKWSPDAIERALAHGDVSKVRAAYHRGAHWNERVEMAQWWSDYLDALREQNDSAILPEHWPN